MKKLVICLLLIKLIILSNFAIENNLKNNDDLTYIEVGETVSLTANKERLVVMLESDLDNLLAGNFSYFHSKNTIDYLNNFYIPNLIKIHNRELLIKDNRYELLKDEKEYYKNMFEKTDIELGKIKLYSSNWKLAFSISLGIGVAELGIITLLSALLVK